MRRSIRYAIALVVAFAVTLGTAVFHDSGFLHLGTFVTYALTVAIMLRFPSLLELRPGHGGPYVPGGVLGGGGAFGVLLLTYSVGESLQVGVLVLGLGLVYFGLVCGIWMVDDGTIEL